MRGWARWGQRVALVLAVGSGALVVHPAPACAAYATGDFALWPGAGRRLHTITLGTPAKALQVSMPAALGELVRTVSVKDSHANTTPCPASDGGQRYACPAVSGRPSVGVVIEYDVPPLAAKDYPRYVGAFPVTVIDPATGTQGTVTTTVRPRTDLAVEAPRIDYDGYGNATAVHVTVVNHGPDDSGSAWVGVGFSGSFHLQSLADSCEYHPSEGYVSCVIGILPNGGRMPVDVRLGPDSKLLRLVLSVKATGLDQNLANDGAVIEDAQTPPGGGAPAPVPGQAPPTRFPGAPPASAAPGEVPSGGAGVDVPPQKPAGSAAPAAARPAAGPLPVAVLLAAASAAALLLAVRAAVLRRRRRQEDAFATGGTRDFHVELDRIRANGD